MLTHTVWAIPQVVSVLSNWDECGKIWNIVKTVYSCAQREILG